MAVRLTFKLDYSISSTQADEKDLGNVQFQVRTDSFAEGGSWKTVVGQGAADVRFYLDNIAVGRFLALRVSPVAEEHPAPELSIKLNDVGNTPLPLKPPDDSKVAVFMVTSDSLTALYVSNPGSYDAELTISVAGD